MNVTEIDTFYEPIYFVTVYSFFAATLWDALCVSLLFRWFHKRSRSPITRVVRESNEMMFELSATMPPPVLGIIREYIAPTTQELAQQLDQLQDIVIISNANSERFEFTEQKSRHEAYQRAVLVREYMRALKLCIWIALIAYRWTHGWYDWISGLLQIANSLPRNDVNTSIVRTLPHKALQYSLQVMLMVERIISILQLFLAAIPIFFAFPIVVTEFWLGVLFLFGCMMLQHWLLNKQMPTPNERENMLTVAWNLDIFSHMSMLFISVAEMTFLVDQVRWTTAMEYHFRIKYARAPRWEDLLTIL